MSVPHYLTTSEVAKILGLTGKSKNGSPQGTVRRLVAEGHLQAVATYRCPNGVGLLFTEQEVDRVAQRWAPSRVSRGEGLPGSIPREARKDGSAHG